MNNIKVGTILDWLDDHGGCYLRTRVVNISSTCTTDEVVWKRPEITQWKIGEKDRLETDNFGHWLESGRVKINKEYKFKQLMEEYERTRNQTKDSTTST